MLERVLTVVMCVLLVLATISAAVVISAILPLIRAFLVAWR